jgi:cellulose synthase/poly-beta-1,6-N-acetylglucosamine synthase-like glycosyltransferase
MQDYPHNLIEVILVDGQSTDKTKQLMLDFQTKETSFEKVFVLDNPKRYLACGWNVALKEVGGDVVLRVDAHTKFPKDFISKNMRQIASGKDICGGKVLSVLQKDNSWNRTLLSAENSMFGGGFTFFRRGETARYTDTLAFAAYRKNVFDTVGSYDERLVRTEDNEMHYRMRKAGFKFFFSPDIVSYRFNRSSLTGLLRQKYLNGYWVGLTHAVCPMAFSIFYLVPLLFIFALITALVLLPIATWPLWTLAIAYLLVLLLALTGAIQKEGFRWPLLFLPAIIFALHLCYGVGTAVGLCKEDIIMRGKYKSLTGRMPSVVYWIVELVMLPFKTFGWVCKLLCGRE